MVFTNYQKKFQQQITSWKKQVHPEKFQLLLVLLSPSPNQALDRDINENDALDALLLFLSKFSISCLKSFLRGTALPNRNNSDNWKLVLVSTYVSKLEISEPERFENFILLVEGHMLANALLCPDLQSVSKVYKKVTLYFDTRLLLQYLGLEGDAKKQVIDELIELINKVEGDDCMFFSYLG